MSGRFRDRWWRDGLGRPFQEPKPKPPAQVRPRWPVELAARNVVFCAEEPQTALAAPPRFATVAISADAAYRHFLSDDLLRSFRGQGRTLVPWCDGTHTPLEEAFAMRRHYAERGIELGWPLGQAETPYELLVSAGVAEDGSRPETCRVGVVVGNPNAWTPAQRVTVTAMCERGELAVIAETYTNEGDAWPDEYSGQGVPVASFCLGLYRGRWRYVPEAEYRARTPAAAWPHVGVYHAAGVRDWNALA